MKTEINPHRFIVWTLLGFSQVPLDICITDALLQLSARSGEMGIRVSAKKNAAVQQIQPKLIILSGSNSLFGFSAERLTKSHGVPTVNAAIHAGLGPNYILDYGKKYIAPDRIFVLPFEYQLYGKPSSPASVAYLYQVVGFDPDYFASMSLLDKIKFSIEIPLVDRSTLLKARIWNSPKNDIDGYQSRTLNAFGDETANTLDNRKEFAVTRVNRAQIKDRFFIDEEAWNAIAKFVLDVRLGGGDVVLTYPNIYSGYLDTKINSEFFADLARRAKEINVMLVGNPETARFEEPLLFDTQYHQNTVGQTKATDRLYEDLRAAGIFRRISR